MLFRSQAGEKVDFATDSYQGMTLVMRYGAENRTRALSLPSFPTPKMTFSLASLVVPIGSLFMTCRANFSPRGALTLRFSNCATTRSLWPRPALDLLRLQQPTTAAADYNLLWRPKNNLTRLAGSLDGQIFVAIRSASIGRKNPERLLV